MQNFVSVSTTDVASAVDSASAFAAVSLTQETRAVKLDNGFNVDMVVMRNAIKLSYLRAGAVIVLDLKADESPMGNAAAPGSVVLSLYAANGVPPTSVSAASIFLFDSML